MKIRAIWILICACFVAAFGLAIEQSDPSTTIVTMGW